MENISRRKAVKLAAGLAMGSGVLAAATTGQADDLTGLTFLPSDPKATDEALLNAIRYPLSYMFTEQIELKLEGDRSSREVVITSALNERRQKTKHYIRPGTMRVFRADPYVDDFTREGGLYWRYNRKDGQVKFKKPGQVVLVVRDNEQNVRFYTLMLDLRC